MTPNAILATSISYSIFLFHMRRFYLPCLASGSVAESGIAARLACHGFGIYCSGGDFGGVILILGVPAYSYSKNLYEDSKAADA